MSVITRKKDEDIQDYKIRLFMNRDIYDLSWEDVRKLINSETGSTSSSDKYRHEWSHWRKCMEWLEKNNGKMSSKLDIKKAEIISEKAQLRDQRREISKFYADAGRIEYIRSELVAEVHNVEKYRPITAKEISPEILAQMDVHREAVLMLSDWHVGLFARNYWNYFDTNEFYRRVEVLFAKSVEYALQSGAHILHLFNLGDYVNGIIHTTTRILSTEDVISQTMRVAEVLTDIIVRYAEVFPMIMLYFVRGNHDRVTANKSDELSQESFADLIQWYLKARLDGIESILFMENKYDSEIANAEVCGKIVYACHGHRDKPENVVQNLSLMTKQVPDYVLMGHIHHMYERDVQGTELIINSSLSGVDSFAKEIRKISKPAQKLLIFDENGRLCTYNIILG